VLAVIEHQNRLGVIEPLPDSFDQRFKRPVTNAETASHVLHEEVPIGKWS
jgi:hypothetical protein